MLPAGRIAVRLARSLCLTCLGATLLVAPITAADDTDERADYIRSHYSKFEYRIPMRDGMHLFTAVYIPNDRATTYPFLMFRTPYSVSPYGADRYKNRIGPSAALEEDGFIFVFQDVRGKYMSQGEFINMRPHREHKTGPQDVDESTDTYDTIQWLLENIPGHNGRAGQWGISYPGFYSSAGMIDSHPALKAVSPQAPIADWFWDDMHHNGAFILPLSFNFFSSFGKVRPEPTTERPERFDHRTPDGYQFFLDLGPLKNARTNYLLDEIPFWEEMTTHPNYDDFWQARNILPHLKNIHAAVMVVGGLFDTEDLYGPLQTYRAVEEQNPDIFNMLVMGPWSHGAWNRQDGDHLGDVQFGFKTGPDYRANIERPFFLHFLKDGPDPALPEAMIFETGANRWRRFTTWPPPDIRREKLYLHAGGGLGSEPPTAELSGGDSYVSDPARPVPYTMEITSGWARDYMTEDQRFAAWRPDVLVYRGETLTRDLTLAGPVRARLWVSTTGTAADWIVKIIDVNPGEMPGGDEDEELRRQGGRQTLVRAEVFRGRFRESFTKPQPFVPGEITQISFDLHDILHTFKEGHRIMIQVQSTWFPFVDRNPQTWVPNIFEATEDDFKAATHTIYRSPDHPSHVEIGILPAADEAEMP
ncbi:MAG: CocE/NonD family hydrolase [Acidobacteria bacterium]|nr:MAG: CocE/NonD family hydrolase [Acidobacteriota bacterium]